MTGAPPRALIVAGEVSGDHQGALLAAALRRRRPDLALSGVGGPEMAAAGVDVLIESLRWGVIGYLEAYVRLPVFAVRFWRLVRLIERMGPDLLVLVDFPGMNRELVRHFSGRVPMVYFFPPQTHARRGRSAARMARAAIRLLAVFPFEAETYRRAGADVVFIGHPAVDAAAAVTTPRESLRAEWGVGSGPVVGLLPGSRAQEIRAHLPPMLEAARALGETRGVQWLLPIAEVMQAADLIGVAAGTAPVEAACIGVPMVAVVRLSRLTYWIGRRWVVTPEFDRLGFTVPNIVMGRRIVPELLQDAVTGPRIRAEVERFLSDPAALARMRGDLGEVRQRLGPPGAVERAAAETLRALDSRPPATLR